MTTSPNTLLSATEAEFQTLVIDYAHLMGWQVMHSRPAQSQSGKWSTPIQGDPGFPDLVLARGKVVILAELKAEKGQPSPPQIQWWLAADSEIWRPSDWSEIQKKLGR